MQILVSRYVHVHKNKTEARNLSTFDLFPQNDTCMDAKDTACQKHRSVVHNTHIESSCFPIFWFLISLKRQAIVENHNRRREQLRKLLADTKEKVAGHESGRSLLEGEEYATLKKRIGLYEKKVSTGRFVLVLRKMEYGIDGFSVGEFCFVIIFILVEYKQLTNRFFLRNNPPV
jgi:hypothetical protein